MPSTISATLAILPDRANTLADGLARWLVYYIVIYSETVSPRARDGLGSLDFDAHNIPQNSQVGALELVAGDKHPRGVYKLLRIHLGLFHFQFRISGMSSPYLSMYCLCSISLSLSCCFR